MQAGRIRGRDCPMSGLSGDAETADSERILRLRFKKAVAGDVDAFWALIEPYSGLIYSVAFGILKDPERAQDILHDAYLKAFRSLNNLRNPGLLASWLHSLTRNLCYEVLRKDARAERKKIEVFRHRPRVVPIYEVLVKEEELRQLQKALATLPEPFRIVLGMKYMNRYSCKEIAEVLDISIAAVKSRLFEARKLLAHRMTELEKQTKPDSKLHLSQGRKINHGENTEV